MRVTISWRNVARLPQHQEQQGTSHAFNKSQHSKTFKLLGIAEQFQLQAANLTPNSTYFQRINRKVNRSPQDKSYFEVSGDLSSAVTDTRLDIPTSRVYDPGIAVVGNRLTLATSAEGFPVDSLISMRALNKMGTAAKVTKETYHLIQQFLSSQTKPEYRARPLHLLELEPTADVPASFVRFNREELVGLLIGNADYGSMHPDIPDHIFDACAELNKKSVHEYLLASKQGLLVIRRNKTDPKSGSNGLYERACACFELASVIHMLLSDYPQLRQIQPLATDAALRKAQYLVKNSGAIFNASFSTRELWRILVNEMALDALFDLVASSNHDAATALSGPQ